MTSFPLRTDRLLLRTVRVEDAEALWARRNDEEVARHQYWTLPYERATAEALTASAAKETEPRPDEWFMLTIADPDDREVIGDVVFRLLWDGRAAEIGYELAAEHFGNGYAVEAVDAIVRWLFEERGVVRIQAEIDPANRASAQVLERNGFLFEGHARLAYWVGNENTDSWHYGMLRSDWDAWLDRPRHRPTEVRLVEITPENDRAVRSLVTHKSQEHFVSPVLMSLADALIPEIYDGAPVVPWYRAIEADGDIVGFAMLTEITDAHPEPFLWRLMVDRMHQRRGIGTMALELIAEVARSWGAPTMSTTYVEGRGSPKPLYDNFGFVPTGEFIDGETEARLVLR